MLAQLMPALRTTLVLAFYTGIVFPVFIWIIGNGLFHAQANGSLITDSNRVIGSSLLGQNFAKPEYFHPRPSAAGSGYAGEASGGTNLGPTSQKLITGAKDFPGVAQLAETYRKENFLPAGYAVPPDAVTRSASGLDPHITVLNATEQVSRVAKARKLSEVQVTTLIHASTEGKQFGLLGEASVNVLKLNLALDALGKEN